MNEMDQLRARVEHLEMILLKVQYMPREQKLKETIKNIRFIFNEYFKVDINKKDRNRFVVTARQMYYKFLRIHTGLSLYSIGNTLDINQDHATVRHAICEFDEKVVLEKQYRDDWRAICNIIEKQKQETEV